MLREPVANASAVEHALDVALQAERETDRLRDPVSEARGWVDDVAITALELNDVLTRDGEPHGVQFGISPGRNHVCIQRADRGAANESVGFKRLAVFDVARSDPRRDQSGLVSAACPAAAQDQRAPV